MPAGLVMETLSVGCQLQIYHDDLANFETSLQIVDMPVCRTIRQS